MQLASMRFLLNECYEITKWTASIEATAIPSLFGMLCGTTHGKLLLYLFIYIYFCISIRPTLSLLALNEKRRRVHAEPSSDG